MNNRFRSQLFFAVVFAVSMGYFESALVVYLRELFYPEGFVFPLKIIPRKLIIIEIIRELATMLMLFSVAALTGRKRWERFGFFIFIFGIWDIFYYIFLKATIDWPLSLTDWDVLFLIPLPWIGPVVAPVLTSVLMIICGILLIKTFAEGRDFKPTKSTWLLSILATAVILYSFMHDLDATIHLEYPQRYPYWMLISGLVLYAAAFIISYSRNRV